MSTKIDAYTVATSDNNNEFAQAFGEAFVRFLQNKGISQSQAARQLGLDEKKGKSRLNTYCKRRQMPNAEILYLLCTKLDFNFEYRGYKISAATLNGTGTSPIEMPPEQLVIQFSGQLNLTQSDQRKFLSISVKRPPGRMEVSVLMDGTS